MYDIVFVMFFNWCNNDDGRIYNTLMEDEIRWKILMRV